MDKKTVSRASIRVKTGTVTAFTCALALFLSIGCASEEKKDSALCIRARAMNEIGLSSYWKGDRKAALTSFGKALSLAEAADSPGETVAARINISRILTEQNRIEEARVHLEKALRTARDIDDDSVLYNALEATGKQCSGMNLLTKAEDCFLEALELAEDLDSRQKQAMALNDLGVVYQKQGLTAEALEKLHHSLALYETVEGRASLEGRGSVCLNLAAIKKEQGKHADAWELMTSSLGCYQQLGDSEALVTCHADMGSLMEDWGKKSDALLQFERAYVVAKQIPSPRWMEISLENIVRLTRELGEEYLHERYEKILKALRVEVYGNEIPM